MAKLEIELSDGTIERLRQLAAARRSSIGDVVTELVDGVPAPAPISDPFWGMFSDDPDLMDEVVEDAMALRQERSARLING